jgi:hypothetical protein
MTTATIGERIELIEEPDKLIVNIARPVSSNLWLSFLSVWLVAWTFGGIFVLYELLSGDAIEKGIVGFLLSWLFGWVVGEVVVVYIWIWVAFRKEIISIQNGLLTIKLDVRGKGQVNEIPLNEISALNPIPSPDLLSGDFVATHYGGRERIEVIKVTSERYKFGIDLEDEDAKVLTDWMRKYVPRNI